MVVILYLFGPKETDFINGDSDLIHNTYDEVVDRSKGFYLKFKIALDKDKRYKNVKKEMIISAYTPDGWNQFRVFDIYNHSNYVEVVATQLHYDLNYKKVFPFVVNRATAQIALNVFVKNFKSDLPNFKFTSNITDLHNFSTDDDLERLEEGHNALEILNRIAARWGGELKVDGYNVQLVKKLGKFTNALLYEHKNIAEFVDETSISEIVTRIHAVTKFRPERPEGSTEEPEEVTIKVVVDSPLINEYAQVYEEDYTNNDARTKDQLISWARLKYSTDNIDKPARSIKVETNIIDGQEINYGDDLVLKYTKHDVDEIIRCVGYQYNPNSKQYISVTLGSNMNSLSSTITGAVHDSTKNQLSNIEKQVQIIKYAANNVNRVTTGPLPIPDPIEGDMWYYHPDGRPNEVELRIFQNGGWVTIVSDMTGENVRRAIADLELEAEELDNSIKASDQKANEAKETAGLAKSAVDALDIITKETADKMVDVEQIAADALADASVARTQAGQTVADALAAVDDARIAMDDAQSALSKANSVEETTNSLVIDVDNLAGEVSLKADSSTVNTLSGTVSSQGTTLTQQAGLIASKANQSTVDTLSGKVSDHTTTLSQHATAINARLTQSQVDNLVSGKGYSTVSYVDTQMSATAGAIRTEMTAIEGKIPTQIGGRNLLRNSRTVSMGTNNSSSYPVSIEYLTEGDRSFVRIRRTNTSSYPTTMSLYSTIPISDINSSIFDNEQTVVSFKARASKLVGSSLMQSTYGGSKNVSGKSKNVNITTEWQTFKVVFPKIPNDINGFRVNPFAINTDISNFYLDVCEWKIEKGNTATDWTPAPEDMMKQSDFNTFKAEYDQSAKGWSAKLLQIEQADYATKTWSNQTFATPQSVTTQLASYAKTTDLNGMVTEAYLATNQYAKQGEINTQLQSYLKTTDLEGKVQSTSAFQDIKATTDRFTRVIGSTDEQAKANIAQIVMTDSLFQTTIRENVTGGGVNRYKKSTSFHAGAGIQSFSKNNLNGFNVTGGSSSPRQLRMNGVIDSNGWWTISGWFRGIQSVNINFTIDIADSAYSEPFYAGTANEWQYFEVTRRVVGYSSVYNFIDINLGRWAYYEFKDIMVEKGKIAHDWSPATDDLATSQQLSDVKQTADSIQALVGTTNDSVARAVMTSSLWETEVSKVVSGELKQDYKTVTSQVANVTKNQEADFGMSASGYNYYNFELENDIPSGTKINVKFFLNISNNQGQQFKLDYISSTGSAENILSMNLTRGQNNVTTSFVASKDYPSNGAKLRLRMYDYSDYIIYFEMWHMKDHQVPIDGSNTGAISSKITQLYDMINLSVLGKEGALSRIAMGEEGIQIDGKLLHITAKTFIDNAVIKSAMIDTLDASKITTGVLNAKNVRVINLDANSISGNEASFIRAMFTARHSALQITGNGITVSKSNGNRTFEVDSDGINFYSNTGPGAYISTQDNMTWNGTSWVDSGVNSVTFASELNHSIGIGYKIYSNGRYVTREAIRLERTGSGTPELHLNLPVKNLIFSRGMVGGADGSYLRNTQNTAGIWMGDNGLVYLKESGSLYGSGWWKNK